MKFLSYLIDSVFGKTSEVPGYSVSESDIDVMTAKAYELTGSVKQLLKDTNATSKIQLREENLLEIRAQHQEIKDICKKIPQIYLSDLDGFETSIEAVASETSDLKKALKL